MKVFRSLSQPGIHRSQTLRKIIALSLFIAAGLLVVYDHLNAHHPVVVFSRPVAAGTRIEPADVRLVQIAPEALPQDAVDNLDDAIGHINLVQRPSQAIATRHDFVDSSLISAEVTKNIFGDENMIFNMVPITLADPTIAGLLQPGDEISIITATNNDTAAEVIAGGGKVIFAISNETNLPGTVPGTVLVSLPDHDAHKVAAAGLHSPLAVVLTGERAK